LNSVLFLGFRPNSFFRESINSMYLFRRCVCTLEQSGFREDEKLEGVLQAAKVADVDHRQAVQLVQTRILKPSKTQTIN
jgi:hypothetical protein